jgi:hypothetical protein
MWKVTTFGRHCLGNVSGYRVERLMWRYTGNPHRTDGMSLIAEIAGGVCRQHLQIRFL